MSTTSIGKHLSDKREDNELEKTKSAPKRTGDAKVGTSMALIQYIVVRKDLTKKPLKWSWGSVISNACHAASVAVISSNFDNPNVQKYITQAHGQMRKVTLAAPDCEALITVAKMLKDLNIVHYLWIEEPEKIPTCLAVCPLPKKDIQPILKSLKLFR
ncbi:hypothetical protein AAMO2058_000855000 [Amorphochlora amoebiformis]